MQPFRAENYYELTSDAKILDEDKRAAVKPLPEGRKLIADYYKEKYSAEIIFPFDNETQTYPKSTEFAENINKFLEEARKKPGNYRAAFLLGTDSAHEVPFIYIRENGREGILYANSQGGSPAVAKMMQEKSGIPVFMVNYVRQADGYSCYTDGLVFGRDTTAINKKTKSYAIPNLLEVLEKTATKGDGFSFVKLPDELLKTAQINNFYAYNKNPNSNSKIYNGLTIAKFRKNYSEKVQLKGREGKDPVSVSNYLRLKGIKLADTIEIKYYLDAMKNEVPHLWTDKTKDNFVKKAKLYLKNQGAPHSGRKGLHQFAEAYLNQLKQTHVQKAAPVSDLIVQVKAIRSTSQLVSFIKNNLPNWNTERRLELAAFLLEHRNEHALSASRYLGLADKSIQTKEMGFVLGALLDSDPTTCCWRENGNHINININGNNFILRKHAKEFLQSNSEVYPQEEKEAHDDLITMRMSY